MTSYNYSAKSKTKVDTLVDFGQGFENIQSAIIIGSIDQAIRDYSQQIAGYRANRAISSCRWEGYSFVCDYIDGRTLKLEFTSLPNES